MTIKSKLTAAEQEQVSFLMQSAERAAAMIVTGGATDIQIAAQAGVLANAFVMLRNVVTQEDTAKAEKASDA